MKKKKLKKMNRPVEWIHFVHGAHTDQSMSVTETYAQSTQPNTNIALCSPFHSRLTAHYL